MILKITTYEKILLEVIERIEVFVINHPFIFQQFMDCCDDVILYIIPIIDSIKQWLCLIIGY